MSEPTNTEILAEVRLIGRAVADLSTEVLRLGSRLLELADDHGQRLLVLERGAAVPHLTNGNGAGP